MNNIGALFAGATGLSSGLWPIFMRESGLQPAFIAPAFGIGVVVLSMPYAAYAYLYLGLGLPSATRWTLLLTSLVFGAGVLVNAGLMIRFTSGEVLGVNMIIWAMVQVSVPIAYTLWKTAQLPSLRLMIGFAAAILAVWALQGAQIGPRSAVTKDKVVVQSPAQ